MAASTSDFVQRVTPMSRLYPERPFLAASVAVFREGKVLLAQRVQGAGAGNFSLPGGMVETGERLEQAALRELEEETGVRARILGFVDFVEVIIHDEGQRVRNHAVVTAFAAQWLEGEATTGPEAAAVCWVDPAAPGDLPMTEGLRAVLLKAAGVYARSLPA